MEMARFFKRSPLYIELELKKELPLGNSFFIGKPCFEICVAMFKIDWCPDNYTGLAGSEFSGLTDYDTIFRRFFFVKISYFRMTSQRS